MEKDLKTYLLPRISVLGLQSVQQLVISGNRQDSTQASKLPLSNLLLPKTGASKPEQTTVKVPVTKVAQPSSGQILQSTRTLDDPRERSVRAMVSKSASQQQSLSSKLTKKRKEASASPLRNRNAHDQVTRVNMLFASREPPSQIQVLVLGQMLEKKLKQTPGKCSETNRKDVIVKKLLRMMKHYYDLCIDAVYKYKSKRSRKNKDLFLKFTDDFVKKNVRTKFLRIFKISQECMSEHLAALVQPRSFLIEISDRKKDIELFLQTQNDLQTLNQSEPSGQKAENLLKSWSAQYKQYVERLARVRELCEDNRNLLYLKYNKLSMKSYISKTENLLLLEHFLEKLLQLFGNLKSKVIIDQGDNLVNKRVKKVNNKAASAGKEEANTDWDDELQDEKMGFNDFAASLLGNVEEWLKKKAGV